MRRFRHVVLFVSAGAAMLALFNSASAEALPIRPDRSFGSVGKVVITVPSTTIALAAERGPNQTTVVGVNAEVDHTSNLLIRFTRNGKVDRSFGDRGRVRVSEVDGQPFRMFDFAVDDRGRVVVAGKIASTDACVVLRLTPSGNIDRTFGEGGAIVTEFGLPRYLYSPSLGYPLQPAESAIVWLEGLAIDPQERIVLNGKYLEKVNPMNRRGEDTNGFIARLTESGESDRTFSGDGVVDLGQESVNTYSAAIEPDSSIVFGGAPGIGKVSADGAVDQSFEGIVRRPEGPMAIDRFGRIVVVSHERSTFNFAYRLHPNGSSDFSFGDAAPAGTSGVQVADPHGGEIGIVAPAADGSVFLEGRLRERTRGPYLMRLTPAGRVDQSFGTRGRFLALSPHAIVASLLPWGSRHLLVASDLVPLRPGGERRITLNQYLLGPNGKQH